MLRFLILFLLLLPAWAASNCDPVATVNNGTDGTSWLFPNVSIGTASADRKIVMFYGATMAGVQTPSVTVTFDSDPATSLSHDWYSETNTIMSGAVIIARPTGTTANVTVNSTATASRMLVRFYACTDIDSTPFDVDTFEDAGPSSISINIPVNGVVLAATYVGNGTTVSWTGLTEDYDSAIEFGTLSSGHNEVPAGETGRAISSTANADMHVTAVSFGPPPSGPSAAIYVIF